MRQTMWMLLILALAIPSITTRSASAQNPNACYLRWTWQQGPIPNGSCSKYVYYATLTDGLGYQYIGSGPVAGTAFCSPMNS